MEELNSFELFACIGEGVIITNLDGEITYINPAAEKVTEYSSQRAIGMNLCKVFPLVNANTGDTVESPITMALDAGEAVELNDNIVLISKSGIKKFISANCSPIKNSKHEIIGTIIIFRNITRIKTIERKLHRECDIIELRQNRENIQEFRDSYLDVLECLPAIIIRIGLDNQCNYINRQWIEFTGQPVEKGLQRGWINFVHPEDISMLMAKHTEAVKGQKPYSAEMRLLHFSDDYHWVIYISKPFYNKDGSFDGYIALAIDITDQKVTMNNLERAKEAAENANKAKSEFLANMSHEVRTPLNGIVGMLNLVLMSDIDNKLRDNLNVAKSSTDSLLKVINDILDFSKIEAGKLLIENIDFDIYRLIEDVIIAHTIQANQKRILLKYQFSSGVPKYLKGDSMRIKQILDNLIGNAIKFTENGRIVLSIEEHSRKQESFELLFSVSDTGIGIDEDEMDRLFRSFSQMNGTIARRFGGTGLGLAISKQLVEMMGGTIWVESKKGEGSTFFFTLPLMVGQVPEKKKSLQNLVKSMNIPLKILLVEDNEVHQNVFQQLLSDKGHTMYIAPNGREALEAIRKEKFDIIFMDIKMPEIDGIDTTQIIRQMEGDMRNIPIVAVTAYALKGDKERFLSLGMDEYIAKPVQIEELYSVLDLYGKKKREKDIIKSLTTDEKFIIPTEPIELEKIIGQHIQKMKEALDNNEIPTIEKEANELKRLATGINADELKRIAFTIELAARRDDLNGIKCEMSILSDKYKKILEIRRNLE